MTPAPRSRGQAAAALRESLVCFLFKPRPVGARQVGDAIKGAIEVRLEIAGACEDVVVSLASIPLPRTLAPSQAVAPPSAAP